MASSDVDYNCAGPCESMTLRPEGGSMERTIVPHICHVTALGSTILFQSYETFRYSGLGYHSALFVLASCDLLAQCFGSVIHDSVGLSHLFVGA